MGQRNMLYTSPIPETEHGHINPGPCVVPYSGIPSFPQPTNNNCTISSPSGNGTSFNPQHLPENGPLPHAITQFNGLDHHPHHPANNLFMTPTRARFFQAAINHGIQDQLAFSSIYGSIENSQVIDVFKRKNAEGFHGNIRYIYPTPGSGSSIGIPLNMEGTIMDGSSLVMEPMVHSNGRNMGSGAIGADPVIAHSCSHLIPGNYSGQPLQAVSNPWLGQQFCGNGGDGGAFSWGMPYLQEPINGSGLDANVGLHGYQVTTSNRIPRNLEHAPAITPHHGSHNIHHPPPPLMLPMQGLNIEFHSQVASSSQRHPTNTNIMFFQNGMEPPMSRFVDPTQPTGLGFFRPHGRELMIEAAARHRVFPHFRVLPEDGVAILDISGFHEAGHLVDHHRDMRLDIDHMSYEELLALGEQIGSAGSGLSNDFILEHLKMRVFAAFKSSSKPKDASSADQELNSCVICQTNYDDQEQIGVLDCGHEYHVECVKKWLTMKNTCPVCKSTALAAKAKES
ncbi:hypothetical protein E3N88_05414 [Mikania micrantha]|uniref:RING-type E3 ubiquitin transferase n=1 Tax=Mikania micrantha TaxID=192012 RepID=A0A5N6PKX2_9ASTR|nr:hypothetical protein E3N88_05414 [Mikania micrantha]